MLMMVVTVGTFAFVAATVGGVFRPPLYTLAGNP
jgi:hypothetical protein